MSATVWLAVGLTSPCGSNVLFCASVVSDTELLAGLLDPLPVVDWAGSFAFALEEAPPPCEGDGFCFPSSDGETILTVHQQLPDGMH